MDTGSARCAVTARFVEAIVIRPGLLICAREWTTRGPLPRPGRVLGLELGSAVRVGSPHTILN
jgi:hypothetical protein